MNEHDPDERPSLYGEFGISAGSPREAQAPPVDMRLLLRLARKEATGEEADLGYTLMARFRSWHAAYTDLLAADVTPVADPAAKNIGLFAQDAVNVLIRVVRLDERRDPFTVGHGGRVAKYAMVLGRSFGLFSDDVEILRLGGLLHDIGKVAISDAILAKPGILTAMEFEIVKQHTVIGAELVGSVPELAPIVPIVRSHHERWDGKGYPDGLAGEAIPFLARLLTVVDSVDALHRPRSYRAGLSFQQVAEVLKQGSGTMFDPRCVQALLTIGLDALEEQPAMASATKRTTPIIPVSDRFRQPTVEELMATLH